MLSLCAGLFAERYHVNSSHGSSRQLAVDAQDRFWAPCAASARLSILTHGYSASTLETAVLLQSQAAHVGRFTFPFGHLVVLNNCTRQQLDERGLSEVFPARRVFARDEFEALSPDETIDRLKSCFDPRWAFGQLSERQISILRSVIHPQIVISPLAEATKAEQPLTALDLRQERNAHALGDGHRIVYGVAGSGKTVILIARAGLVAQDPNKQVLLLCFNRALAEYFQRLFAQTTNVTCLNFHQWGNQRNGVRYRQEATAANYAWWPFRASGSLVRGAKGARSDAVESSGLAEQENPKKSVPPAPMPTNTP